MNRDQIMEALAKQKRILTLQGYKVAYIAVYGSQNYSLDVYTEDYQSDLDMKAIIVPTLDDLIENSKPVSTVVDTEWGQCDVKDIRTFFEVLLKANPAYVEAMLTDCYIIDEYFITEMEEVRYQMENLIYALRGQFLRAAYGMMLEKEKALCHPYPSIAHKIEKYGFDGKQSSHVLRLYLLIIDYFCGGKTMKDSLVPEVEFRDSLLNHKLNNYSLEYAKEHVEKIVKAAKKLKEDISNDIDQSAIDYSTKEEFLTLSQDIIKIKIVSDILNKR